VHRIGVAGTEEIAIDLCLDRILPAKPPVAIARGQG
jgi:hypothetical protein